MEEVLWTRDLGKRYGDFWALTGLDMHVPKGAIYGFVGKNGAGKTTLIRTICGLQQPASGEYTLFGQKHTGAGIWKARRRMGALVETPSIYREMSAQDNLKAQYRMLGLPSFEGIDELLELVGLTDAGRKKAKDFSLGMRQRLGIAIALCGDPDFLVLDEPANGLDPEGIIEIRELILRLNQEQQITVLISSHILDELARLATHFGFIDHGRMVQEISARDLAAACRKCIRITVSDILALARVLEEAGIEYVVISELEADIFGAVNISQLALALAAEHCEVRSLERRDEGLESYYLNLVGGGRHA